MHTTIFLLSVVATASIQATGADLRRRYQDDVPFHMLPPTLKPQRRQHLAPQPSHLPLRSRYPSQRIKPSINSGPKLPNPYGTRPSNMAGIGPQGHRNPSISSGVHPQRPRPTYTVSTRPVNQSGPKFSVNGPGEIQGKIRMKPVFEEGMIPKPVYINSFSELEQSESHKSMDSKNVNYEPLGNYAKF